VGVSIGGMDSSISVQRGDFYHEVNLRVCSKTAHLLNGEQLMPARNGSVLTDVAAYYETRIKEHGQTPAGVDWNSSHGQIIRFDQLLKLVDSSRIYSITDIGCGYGALADHVLHLGHDVHYIGVDVSQSMIAAGRSRYPLNDRVNFQIGTSPNDATDYAVASGIFNVRLDRSDDEWLTHMVSTLDVMNKIATRGFAFNCLTSYSDEERMRPDLYYANPLDLFDLCKRRFSPHVALHHDYGLYEFTIIVRKS